MNFWIAWKATNDEAYPRDFYRITDYLVRIQIEDPDPVIDGGWMRGFDYSLWEYFVRYASSMSPAVAGVCAPSEGSRAYARHLRRARDRVHAAGLQYREAAR
jgi:hypothetical protein